MVALEVNSLLAVSVEPQAKCSLNCKKDLQFKFEEDLKSHMTIAAVFVAMALVFAGRYEC